MPAADLTLEAATLLAVAFCAASLGARYTSDRLGGVAAAPIVLGLVAIALFLPENQSMILGAPSYARWADAHEWWRVVLVVAIVSFVWLNRTSGSHRSASRMRFARRAPRPV